MLPRWNAALDHASTTENEPSALALSIWRRLASSVNTGGTLESSIRK
jgi:hypothetical protein